MTLNDLKIKINWSKFYIGKDCTSYNEYINFDLTPEDFLEFAKEDYRNLDNRGLVGVLSNSKRAIDCQVDWIISYLGFDYLNFNEKNYPNIKKVINDFEKDISYDNTISFKLMFIQALEIAPTFLISKIRKFRNRLEHEYIVPKENEAKEAIEIAELFINATQNIIWHKFFSDYCISNCEYDSKYKTPYIIVSFDLRCSEEGAINLHYNIDDINKGEISIKPKDKEYVFFVKSSISHNFNYLPKIFGCNIDSEFINYEIEEL
ncbi:hypothetical protein DVV91_12315 [Clostridium botulinum]|uniref:hypothetical protein n=1 Tax=Clostridium botulinum TaxID=1491 RepID=UPI000174E6D8|nr:hypothetical protein [Clostridium botulinum]ACD51596.1 hypothetical protein CLH_2471 [Clostridium botulinum E3 str. Alaska E43]AJF30318.1 hypothetical protein ST13_11635 [Clostridium botulinum]AJF33381.1 hypothetical protein ST12_11635 [Clostridium botulinum]MBN1049403.1 hypothetical protein [Clostridium botulinum]MBN1075124.1 hypothetical protein [Clostridium botulinum]